MSLEEIEYPIRLNRYIALCGVTARRKADELIARGRVAVDGTVETSLGRVLLRPSDVSVDGVAIGPVRFVYLVMNKPRGVLSAVSDARGRTVLDLLPGLYSRLGVFPVGRLDRESEGLLLLTNDGKFAQSVIHPSSCIPRTYLVFLRYNLEEKKMKEWARGVIIGDRVAKPLALSREKDGEDGRCFRVVLGEGFKREIRLMVRSLGNRVVRLQRIGLGNFFLKNLPPGAFEEFPLEDMRRMILGGKEAGEASGTLK